jgi:hypothetical protein
VKSSLEVLRSEIIAHVTGIVENETIRGRKGQSRRHEVTIPTNDRLIVFTESATLGTQGFSSSTINIWRIYMTLEIVF